MKVTLRQMQVFDAVATLGSVSRAADALGMSQSAASSALTDFQIVLRRTLFAHARGRPLRITDEGRRLHLMVRSILGEIRDLEVTEADAPLSGRLVIGATTQIAETVLPALCVEFMRRHPGVQMRIEAEPVRTLLDRLTRFELETALIDILPDIDGIELRRWRRDELVLVVASSHPLAGRKGLRLADLAGYPWCTREAHSSTTAQLRYLTHDTLGPLPVVFEATSNWAVRHAVIAGGGIGLLSRTLVGFDLDNGRLRALDVAGFNFNRPLSIARPREIWRSRLTSTFDAFLAEMGEPG